MKILIVCSGNYPEPEKNFAIYQAFINDQMDALSHYHLVEFDLFLIKGKGFKGYLSQIKQLRYKVKSDNFDLIHAHFSLSGLLSIIACNIPVIVTYHGSDINLKSLNIISAIISFYTKHVIYVSNRLMKKALRKPTSFSVIPCGIDLNIFRPINNQEAISTNQLPIRKPFILFSSSFENPIKNFRLAKEALDLLPQSISIIELKNYSRSEVNLLLNEASLLLMTSFSEGSPQIIKEAMACNLPIVSTDVGDVKDIIGNTFGCFLTTYDPKDISDNIQKALNLGIRTKGRKQILHLDNKIIAHKIHNIYNEVANEQSK